MARRSTRQDPWGCRGRERDGSAEGGHENFFREDADRPMISVAHGNKPIAPPDARFFEPIRPLHVEMSGMVPGRESFSGSGVRRSLGSCEARIKEETGLNP